jgi:modulator of FtsH protease HflK
MPWNEPGNKDPWGRRPKDQGPPDLEELLRNLNARLAGLFGGRSTGDGGGSSGGGKGAAAGAGIVAAVLILIWLFSGFYIVDAGERGLVLRFGRYVATTGPGPHWHLPYPFERVETVAVDLVRVVQHEATMLTEDENIVSVDVAVQYRVKDASNYAFNVRVPDDTLRQLMESATRDVVGTSTLEYVLGRGRAEVAQNINDLMQRTLDRYQTGLGIITVNLQQSQPPEPVQPAFADVVIAREDRIRFINQAQSYANGVIPRARGQAARIKEEAAAYRARVIAAAQGDVSRFTQLLSEYRNAPQVTRDRLYLNSLESVLSNSSKVMMDTKRGTNLLYLPLDKLLRGRGAAADSSDKQMMRRPGADGFSSGVPSLRAPRVFSGREAR